MHPLRVSTPNFCIPYSFDEQKVYRMPLNVVFFTNWKKFIDETDLNDDFLR
jgi:hypothetical protein